jgi:cobalt-zinc-cadmium efflux system membrane fusion protein
MSRKEVFAKIVVPGLAVLVGFGVVGGAAFLGGWWDEPKENKETTSTPAKGAAELVRDDENQPIRPPTLRLSAKAARALGITSATMVRAEAPTAPRALPPQIGTLAYDSERLFAVRTRFAGEVIKIEKAPPRQRGDGVLLRPTFPVYPKDEPDAKSKDRPYTVGDQVRKGDLLAVVWSKDLGDKKAALIDALIDYRRDHARMKDLEKLLFTEGAVSPAAYYESQRIVRKDLSAINSAERTLRIWKLSDKEIDAIKQEAQNIEDTKRDPKKEQNWARVEVRSPCDGIIVEKNTHLGDWVDPANYATPMFRVADLDKLYVWITPAEEFLPILQRFLKKPAAAPLIWDIHLQADPKAASLVGTFLRIAPTVEPTQHTPLIVCQVHNPGDKLLVGQFVTATIKVPVDPDLVEIPTTAINEDRGQSVVFVQNDPAKLEFALRRVAVAQRFKDVVYVRRKLTDDDRAENNHLPVGFFPIRPLQPGERVVTESVVELSKALRELLAKEELARAKKAAS